MKVRLWLDVDVKSPSAAAFVLDEMVDAALDALPLATPVTFGYAIQDGTVTM